MKKNEFKEPIAPHQLAAIAQLDGQKIIEWCGNNADNHPNWIVQLCLLPNFLEKYHENYTLYRLIVKKSNLAIAFYEQGKEFLQKLDGHELVAICAATFHLKSHISDELFSDDNLRKRMPDSAKAEFIGSSNIFATNLFSKGDTFLAKLSGEVLLSICHATIKYNFQPTVQLIINPVYLEELKKYSSFSLKNLIRHSPDVAKALYHAGYEYFFEHAKELINDIVEGNQCNVDICSQLLSSPEWLSVYTDENEKAEVMQQMINSCQDYLMDEDGDLEISIDCIIKFEPKALLAWCKKNADTKPELILSLYSKLEFLEGYYKNNSLFYIIENSFPLAKALHQCDEAFLGGLYPNELQAICQATIEKEPQISIDIYSNPRLRNHLPEHKYYIIKRSPVLAKALFSCGESLLKQLYSKELSAICQATVKEDPRITIEIFSNPELIHLINQFPHADLKELIENQPQVAKHLFANGINLFEKNAKAVIAYILKGNAKNFENINTSSLKWFNQKRLDNESTSMCESQEEDCKRYFK